MKFLKWIALFFWYVLYVELALTYYDSVLSQKWGQPIRNLGASSADSVLCDRAPRDIDRD